MGDIPDQSNFYGSLHTNLSRHQIAQLYRGLGWEVRKCGWAEYEIRCSFAELVIETESPILIHGTVADVVVNAEVILAPLGQARVSYTAECYDQAGVLLREFKTRTVEDHLAPEPAAPDV